MQAQHAKKQGKSLLDIAEATQAQHTKKQGKSPLDIAEATQAQHTKKQGKSLLDLTESLYEGNGRKNMNHAFTIPFMAPHRLGKTREDIKKNFNPHTIIPAKYKENGICILEEKQVQSSKESLSQSPSNYLGDAYIHVTKTSFLYRSINGTTLS